MRNKPTISEAKAEYEYHLKARGLAPRTVKNNIQVLNRWIDINGDRVVSNIGPADIDRFFAVGNWGPATQNLYLSILRGSFFPWLRRHNYLPRDYDPSEGWRNVRTETSEQFWLPVDQFPALLDNASCTRDRAILALGLYTFMRGGEIKTLRLQDVDLDRYTLTVKRWKTKETDTMPISLELATELETWIRDYRKQVGFTLQPEWYLVPARGKTVPIWDYETKVLLPQRTEPPLKPEIPLGKPYQCVHRALKELGYAVTGTGAHTLRRSGARALFDRLRVEGYDGALRRVASMLGHKQTKTTEIYLGLSLERQQRNDLLAGQVMFPALQTATVVPIKEAKGGYRG